MKMSNCWKRLLLFAALVLMGSVQAEELAIQAQQPWKKREEKGNVVYVLDVASGWPNLSGTVETKAGGYYLVTWKLKSSVVNNSKLLFQVQVAPEGQVPFTYYYTMGTDWNSYTAYFYAPESGRCMLRFCIDPNMETQIQVSGIEFKELTADQLRTNLLTDGNFEANNLPTGWRCAYGTKQFPASIAASKDFTSGEKSMMLDLAGAGGGPAGINSYYMPVELGKRAEFKFWARADDEQVIMASIQGWGPKHSGEHFYKEEKFKVDTEWREYRVSVIVPTDVEHYPDLQRKIMHLCIRADKHREGKVYFDDLVFLNE